MRIACQGQATLTVHGFADMQQKRLGVVGGLGPESVPLLDTTLLHVLAAVKQCWAS